MIVPAENTPPGLQIVKKSLGTGGGNHLYTKGIF